MESDDYPDGLGVDASALCPDNPSRTESDAVSARGRNFVFGRSGGVDPEDAGVRDDCEQSAGGDTILHPALQWIRISFEVYNLIRLIGSGAHGRVARKTAAGAVCLFFPWTGGFPRMHDTRFEVE